MNRVDLVVVSDVHVHPWASFSDGSGVNNTRLKRTLDVLGDTLEEALEQDSLWLCAGDIIHSTGYALHEVSSPLIEVLSSYPEVEKVIIPGNHDSISSSNNKISLEETFIYSLQKAVPNLHALDNTCYETVDGLRIWGFPAQNKTEITKKAVERFVPEPGDIALFHDFVKGSSFGTGMSAEHGLDPDFLLNHFNLSIVGDVHNPTLHREGDKAILVPGSLEPQNFGDKGPRGYWIVTVEEREDGWYPVEFEDIDSGSPQFITVEDPSEVKDDGNYYRVLGGNGEVPENAKAVKSPPTIVESRDLLEGAQNQREILQKWYNLNPPSGRFTSRYIGTGLDILKRQDEIIPRKARIKRVEGENFFSYEKLEYDVQDGVYLVVGHSNDFNSNGAGKSSLLESIYYCLFGKTTKGVSAADVIRWGESSCRVKVEIELDGKLLTVERSRTKHSIDLEVFYDGEEVTAATNTELSDRLEGILGFTPNLFKALGYFSQEDLTLLSRSTDAELKGILADLRGLSAYQDAAEEAGSLAREASSNVDKYSSKVNTLTEEIQRDEKSVEESQKRSVEWVRDHQKRIKSLQSDVENIEEKLAVTKQEKDRRVGRVMEQASVLVDRAEEKYPKVVKEKKEDYLSNILEGLVRELEQKKESLSEVKERLGDRADADTSMVQELLKNFKNDARNLESDNKDLSRQAGSLESEIEGLEKEVEKHQHKIEALEDENHQEEMCPTCGQSLSSGDSKEKVKEKFGKKIAEKLRTIRELVEEQGDVEKALEEKKTELKSLSDKVSKLSEINDLVSKRDQIQNRIESLEDKKNNAEETAKAKAERDADRWLTSRTETIKSRVSLVQDTMDERVSKVKKKLYDLETSLKNEREKENPHVSAIEQAKKSIDQRAWGRWKAQRRKRENEIDEQMYNYWKNSFGKTGIQSLLLEDLAGLFNKHRSHIFPVLTRGKYDVQMSATSKTQSGELREKAQYRVFMDGEEIPYANLSGGQRRRVDLGVLLTTTLAASKAHGVPGALGIMVLDEVCSYLDDDGAEALAETLESYCPDVVPSIFVVSQNASHKALYDNIIMVEQDENGVSRVVQ